MSGLKERFCAYCGDSMGLIADKDFSRGDTCGKQECDRWAREEEKEFREEAHRDLDERNGW